MKKIIFIFCLLVSLVACGVDPMSKAVATKSTAALTTPSGTQCAYTSEDMPVCSSDGNSYQNISYAKCAGKTQWSQGHCQCSNSLMVCGSDGYTYTECAAMSAHLSVGLTITKFVACNITPL
jgi:hypothetical protein